MNGIIEGFFFHWRFANSSDGTLGKVGMPDLIFILPMVSSEIQKLPLVCCVDLSKQATFKFDILGHRHIKCMTV